MKSTSRLWRWLGLVFVLSFGALGYLGWQIYLSAPPIPKQVVTAEGEVLFTGEQIQLGQQSWLAAGGQQLGTVWGHGSYVAPDWSADWLHREVTTLHAIRTAEQQRAGVPLGEADQAAVSAWRFSLSGRAPSVIAYWSRRVASFGSVPKRPS